LLSPKKKKKSMIHIGKIKLHIPSFLQCLNIPS